MRRTSLIFTFALALLTTVTLAWQAPAGGPYKVLRKAKVGGEGGTDYIFADAVGRRLYITRNANGGRPATDTTPAVPPAIARISVFNLDTLDLIDEIPDTGGNGATVCPSTGHGFSTSHPDISMFDTKTVKLIKKIPLGKDAAGTQASGDGLYCDSFNDHAYIYSHPTKDATVIDAKDGTVLGVVDLGGTPEQSVADGKGTLYVVMQRESNVAVVDAKTMKVTAHLDFKEKGGSCNGLALDAKNKVLFVACGNSSMRLGRRRIQSRDDGSVQRARQRHDDHRQGKQSNELRGRAEPRHDERRPHHHVRQQNTALVRDVGGTRPCSNTGTGRPAAGPGTRRRRRRGHSRVVHDRRGWKMKMGDAGSEDPGLHHGRK
jgi:hypothetical protein